MKTAPEPEERVEETEAASEEESAEEVAQDLDALLQDVQRERDEYLALAQRAKADFENYRKRAVREASEAERRGKANLARDLVPSIDNLERALRSTGIGPAREAKADAASEEVSAQEALARGVQLVHSELQAALARAGVEPFDPEGEKFDPTLHEAISTQPGSDDVDAGIVVETLERGYRLNGQVLRPARVIVSE
jgi:molecular chaperone GrpE